MACGVVAVLVLASCSRAPGRGAEARAHFGKVVQALQSGSLARAYAVALTPSQQADINSLWIEARELVSAADFAFFQDILRKASPKLASLLALGGSKTPSLGVLATRAKDLSAALGLSSYESFQASDARGLLEAIDRGVAADLLRAADVKARLESLQVTVIAEEGDWARLRFVASTPDGGETEEITEVIQSEGSWLPTSWLNDWESTMGGLRAEIVRLKQAKQQDPELVRKALEDLSRLLDDPTALIALLSPRSAPPTTPAVSGAVPQGPTSRGHN